MIVRHEYYSSASRKYETSDISLADVLSNLIFKKEDRFDDRMCLEDRVNKLNSSFCKLLEILVDNSVIAKNEAFAAIDQEYLSGNYPKIS